MEVYIGFSVKLVIGILILITVIRFMGNKELSELTPLDMIFIVIFSDLVAGVAHSTDLGWQHMIFALLFWAALIFVLEKAAFKSKKVDNFIQGQPKVIIQNGHAIQKVMEEENMSMKELETLMRHDGVWDIRKVELGVLEISGKLNCKLYDQ